MRPRIPTLVLIFFLSASQAYAETKKLTGKNGKIYTLTYFNKPIDLQKFKNYADMSEEELLKEAQKQIKVYKFRGPASSPDPVNLLFKTLKEIPSIVKEYVNPYGPNIGIPKGAFVAKEVLHSSVKKDVMILSDDATYHTLIHEMTHYLFKQAREELGIQTQVIGSSVEIQKLQQNYSRNLRLFTDNKSKFVNLDHEAELLETLYIYADYQYNFLKTFGLEEVAVSKLMLLTGRKDRRISSINSSSYAKYNLAETQDQVALVLKQLKDIGRSVSPEGRSRNAKKIEQLKQLYEKYKEMALDIQKHQKLLS